MLGRPAQAASAAKPNLLYILADDLGYGDLACLNPEGKLPTPNYDRAARDGMIFTDAHAGSAVCTPTRYGLLTGLLRTCGDLLGVKLPDNAGEDSVSILPDLLGTATGPVREAVVHHSINGSFSIRKGPWKLELCPGSGGWSHPRPGKDEVSSLPPIQLYDLTRDISEQRNEMSAYPSVVGELVALLEQSAEDGRSTPGAPRPNEGAVDVWRGVPKEMRVGLG